MKEFTQLFGSGSGLDPRLFSPVRIPNDKEHLDHFLNDYIWRTWAQHLSVDCYDRTLKKKKIRTPKMLDEHLSVL